MVRRTLFFGAEESAGLRPRLVTSARSQMSGCDGALRAGPRSRNLARRQRESMLALGASAALFALFAAGCPQAAPGDAELIFPANYRTTFVEVRDCRNSIEHGATIRVWVNEVGANAYQADQDPLPVGTVVVKEEFGGDDCSNDDDLMFWSVMRKEPAGFDEQARDWRFQEVSAPGRTVTLDGKSTCISCHLAPECLARDLMCTEP